MDRGVFIVFVILLLFPAEFSSQGLPKLSTQPSAAGPHSGEQSGFTGYKFAITIDAQKRVELRIYTGYEHTDLGKERLASILSDYLSMQSPADGKKPLGPVVSIRPNPVVDMKTVVGVARAALVPGTAKLWVSTPDGSALQIAVGPGVTTSKELAIDPLALVIEIDSRGAIMLNRENAGNLSNVSIIETKLSGIFRRRLQMDTNRPGTNEIEKRVWIKMPLTATVADLNKIGNAMNAAGSYDTWLLLDV